MFKITVYLTKISIYIFLMILKGLDDHDQKIRLYEL